MEGIAEDIEELKRLLEQSTRPRVKKLISSEIDVLSQAQKASSEENQVKGVVLKKAPAEPQTVYTTFSTFSWDQDNENVKIYISLEGASQERTEADFKEQQFSIAVHDLNGKNYKFSIPKLNKKIVPERSKVVVKPKRIIVTLKKADRGNWFELKEDKIKKPDVDSKDPMGGIMDLMKNMYNEGDDEMKKAIAKAWTDTRSGKKPDMMKDMDF
eukprot:TRINITY_DN19164_c0_g1_i1.p1 TRINITY_DN19164_c0_g1~~TRINITY_DN19164_c0_g1_i1.p1  ORF type:complete len:213 (+),score=70.46 TRINITY_DN19164_c0_g1_i1:146-784(+)